jgi:hypothetical protein
VPDSGAGWAGRLGPTFVTELPVSVAFTSRSVPAATPPARVAGVLLTEPRSRVLSLTVVFVSSAVVAA